MKGGSLRSPEAQLLGVSEKENRWTFSWAESVVTRQTGLWVHCGQAWLHHRPAPKTWTIYRPRRQNGDKRAPGTEGCRE